MSVPLLSLSLPTLMVLVLIALGHSYSLSTRRLFQTITNSRKVCNSYRINTTIFSTETVAITDGITELPNDFTDAVDRAAQSTISCIRAGNMRIKIEFDTTIGDMTYTSLKNTLPMTKVLLNRLNELLLLSTPTIINKKTTVEITDNDTVTDSDDSTASDNNKENVIVDSSTVVPVNSLEAALATAIVPEKKKGKPTIDKDELAQFANDFEMKRTLRVFFPDMGAAVLARRDWKMGTWQAEVPQAIYTANVQNDLLAPTDQMAIILCPLFSETDYVMRVVEMCGQQNIPCVMINPELVNMDQGYGVRARNLRKNLLNTFTTAYKLKTLPNGAITRQWPLTFSLWIEDETQDGGYGLLKSFSTDPDRETVNELLDESETKMKGIQKEEPNAITKSVGEIIGFFQGLSKL